MRAFGPRFQAFRALGVPPSALHVQVAAGKSAQVRGGVVLATQPSTLTLTNGVATGPADFVLGLQGQPVIVNEANEKWKLLEEFVATSSGSETALSAPGGVYRVDVPTGANLLVEKGKVVGQTTPGKVVYRESRFDIAQVWLGWAWQWSRAGALRTWALGKGLGRSTIAILNKLRALVAHKPASPDAGLISESQPETKSNRPMIRQIAELRKRVSEWWKFVATPSRKGYVWVSSKAFYWTHPPKLLYQGPCSVLVRR